MIFKAHLVLTWALLGAVWFVGVVHYPSFHFFAKNHFEEFEKFHIRRTNSLVIPAMIFEALTGLMLVMQGPIFVLNVFFIGLIWIFTFTGCLPIHLRLKNSFSETLYKKLAFIHGIRIGLWTMRGFVLFLIKYPS